MDGARSHRDGLAELAKRCQELFALTSVAQKAYGDDHHLPAMPLFRQERQRWCLAQHHPGCELFWSLRHKRAIIAQKLRSVCKGMDQQTGENLRPECMQ